MNEPLLRMEDVSYRYDDQSPEVIQGLNFSMNSGEFVCVLGPSGVGKSTWLNLLAGYERVTSGKLSFKGEKITGPSWERGVIFQRHTLYPWLTVGENIAFGLEARKDKTEQIDQQVTYLLENIGLADYRDAYIFKLSGGMQQRVQLARSLAPQPELILMDEPFSALDALTRLDMQHFVRKTWQQEEPSIFMITHDIDEALTLATRLIVIPKGKSGQLVEFSLDYTYRILNGQTAKDYVDKRYLRVKDQIYYHLSIKP
ncbi:ABC transporter ATP-binding protein [Aerococcus urinae]|uniref:ABC transporter ATP-binding protein n=1 Tax=Aerococcus urinae TaxID=1376 RepID=UPI0018A71372|nr:ABC transporter ATP-binding protein [Aerococcus urinae]